MTDDRVGVRGSRWPALFRAARRVAFSTPQTDLRSSFQRARRILLTVLALLAGTGWNGPVAASCIPILGEDNVTRMQRCDQEEAIAASGRASAEGARLREELEREPPLQSGKNPLLGRWMPQGGGSGAATDPVSQLAGMLDGAACTNVFGTGAIEFRKDSMVSIDGGSEESLGPVSYRRRQDTVIVLPQQGFSLLPLQFQDPNRVKLSFGGFTCILMRVGQSAGAAPVATAAQGAGSTSAAPGGTALKEKTAYRCADGAMIFVADCTYGTPSDTQCWTDRYDLPKVNNMVQVVMESRSALASRVQGCEAGGFHYAPGGSPIFLPGAH